jgi:hypothetical protein
MVKVRKVPFNPKGTTWGAGGLALAGIIVGSALIWVGYTLDNPNVVAAGMGVVLLPLLYFLYIRGE